MSQRDPEICMGGEKSRTEIQRLGCLGAGWEKPGFPELSHSPLCDTRLWSGLRLLMLSLRNEGGDGISIPLKTFAAFTPRTSRYLHSTFYHEMSEASPCRISLPTSLQPPSPAIVPSSVKAPPSAHWPEEDPGRLRVWACCFESPIPDPLGPARPHAPLSPPLLRPPPCCPTAYLSLRAGTKFLS